MVWKLVLPTVLVALGGCSLLLDAGDATGADGSIQPGNCPIEPAGVLAAINLVGDVDDPSLTSDGRQLVFNGPSDQIYLARRAARGSAFGAPEAITVINEVGDRLGNPRLSDDGRALYFTSGPTSERRNYVSRRDQIDDSFGEAIEVSVPNPASDSSPNIIPTAILDDETILYAYNPAQGHAYRGTGGPQFGWEFVRLTSPSISRFGEVSTGTEEQRLYVVNTVSETSDIWRLDREESGAFVEVAPVEAAADPGAAESDPWYDQDCDLLYYASRLNDATQRSIFVTDAAP